MNNSHNWHWGRWSKETFGLFYDTWEFDTTPDGLKAAEKRVYWCLGLTTRNGYVWDVSKNYSRCKTKIYIIMRTQFD